MTATLTLQHLWGSPKTWQFDNADEARLRNMLAQLNAFRANAGTRAAVLLAHDENDKLVGAWTRAGAAQLASTIIQTPASPPWFEVRNVLENAVTGP